MLYHVSPITGLRVLKPRTSTLLTALRQAVLHQVQNGYA